MTVRWIGVERVPSGSGYRSGSGLWRMFSGLVSMLAKDPSPPTVVPGSSHVPLADPAPSACSVRSPDASVELRIFSSPVEPRPRHHRRITGDAAGKPWDPQECCCFRTMVVSYKGPFVRQFSARHERAGPPSAEGPLIEKQPCRTAHAAANIDVPLLLLVRTRTGDEGRNAGIT